MKGKISILGIKTNNLKNIDVTLAKNALNLIIGPSGSGKSSLSYDTVANIGQHEFLSMFADNVVEPTYKVRSYENMAAAVPIKQTNYNNNLRSTIATYFGLSRDIALIYAYSLGLEEDFFILNKPENICEHCHGIGFTKEIDESKIINFTAQIKDIPFKCWNKYKDFYTQILCNFCSDHGISVTKEFRELNDYEKRLLLYGESDKKYSIKYKKLNRIASRTSQFYGVLTDKVMMPGFSISDKFYSEKKCNVCNGQRFSQDHEQYKLNGLSIGDFLTTPFVKLKQFLAIIAQETSDKYLEFPLNNICRFIEKATLLNLGHLYFNRSIPTLSGGEMQRLRMVQVFNTQLSDLIIVLDEPLAGLSGDEKESVYKSVVSLTPKNTVVVVDHGDKFVKDASVIIALGEGGGANGGKLIDPVTYLNLQKKYLHPAEQLLALDTNKQSFLQANVNFKIYNYAGANLQLAKNALNLIYGPSGIGKSTLLREYFPQCFEKYTYISQKALNGNRNSSVATVIGIGKELSKLFAKKFNQDIHYFSNQTGDPGICPICSGAGFIEYGTDQENKVRMECKSCKGTGFNPDLKKYKIKGKSIIDLWLMTIEDATEYFSGLDPKIYNTLITASSLLLGHLKIGQPTSSLSGGENIRLKLLKEQNTKSDVLGIDEPFRGLSAKEINSIFLFLKAMVSKGKTLVVVDHTEEAQNYFPNKIRLTCKSGILSQLEE